MDDVRGARSSLRSVALVTAVVAAAAGLAWQASSYWSGDYPNEAGPVIDSLIHGDIAGFLSGRPLMGPLSLIVRAPFAALSLITGGGGKADLYDAAYRFGVFPCALASGILGLWLFRLAERERRPALVRYGALVICAANPLTVKAISYGHPEEILAAALTVGAFLLLLRGQTVAAAVVLIAAIATKQWALLAVPVFAVSQPWHAIRRPLALVAGVVAAIAVPLVLADPRTYLDVHRDLLDVRTGHVFPTSLWWPFTSPIPGQPREFHDMPGWIGLLSHPLIILSSLAVPLALRRHLRDDPRRALLATLALVFLLRAALDPVNNSYYHVPFLIALVAANVISGSFVATLVATASFILLIDLAPYPTVQSATYLVFAAAFGAYLTARARGADWGARLRILGARGPAAARPARSSSAGTSTPRAR